MSPRVDGVSLGPDLFTATTAAVYSAATGPENKSPIWDATATWFRVYGIGILATIVVAIMVRFVLVRIIRRVTKDTIKRANQARPGAFRGTEQTAELSAVLMNQRRVQRAEAMGQLLRGVTTATIVVVTALLLLTQLNVDIAPLLASAGVLGVALGFGAQTMVKDFLTGIFLVAEDQLGVGDVVDLGPAIGTVEEVGLRTTRVRDKSGVVWYVRNGEIVRVGNRSQGWTMAVVDVAVNYNQDLDRVRRLVEKVGVEMDDDPAYDGVLFGTPSYAGVESVQGDTVHLRITAKAAPDQQTEAGRAIRERLKVAFDKAGIDLPALSSVPTTQLPPTVPPSPMAPKV